MTKEKFFTSMGRAEGNLHSAIYGRCKLYLVGRIRIVQGEA